MKKQFTKGLATLFLAFAAGSVFAQEAETFTLVPSELDPAEDGYYEAGVDVDENNDGIMEHHEGCPEPGEDKWGDSDHHESGTQQGFTYHNAMIMPDCAGKGTPPEGWTDGYIQLTKHKYFGTDSAEMGYIVTPAVTNLQSLEIKTGTDVSINNNRTIWMMIESSLDGGETWDEGFFIHQQLTNQGGDVHLYMANGESVGFNQIVADSEAGPVMLRITTYPPPGTEAGGNAPNGERLKIFGIEMVGTPAGSGGPITAVGDEFNVRPFFEIQNNSFVATAAKGKLFVYRITGEFLGSGENIQIPGRGLYVVRSAKGKAKKVFVE